MHPQLTLTVKDGDWTGTFAEWQQRGRPVATPELRALRAWHWRIAMNARAAANSYRSNAGATADRRNGTAYSERQAKACDRRADFHIKAVQALNDVVSGTAEQDCKTLPRESLHNE